MLLLLQENVANLGQIGDLVKVKPGYGRNYLLPRKLAVLADKRNKKSFEHQRRNAEEKKQKVLRHAQELAEKVKAFAVTIQKMVGEEEKIFGSVTHQEIAEAFFTAGMEIDKKSITILDDIKRLGVYKGSIKLHPEVSAEFNIWVVAEQH